MKTTGLRCLMVLLAGGLGGLPVAAPAAGTPAPGIEVCFVLDTTGSMSGLVEGAKARIWSIASEIARLSPRPDVSFCLTGFRDRGDEYVTRLTAMTADMDRIHADLTAFRAEGGGDTPEAVNQALYETITNIGWSPGDDVIKVIYLTGDAPPHMDYTDEPALEEILALARQRGIVVNAIQCGVDSATRRIWQAIARSGDEGRYAAVPQSGNMRVVETPVDQDFVAIQAKLARTLMPYGDTSLRARVVGTRERMAAAADGVVADRLSYFGRSGAALVGEGDLLADLEAGRTRLSDLDTESLPDALRGLSPDERQQVVETVRRERAEYRRIIDGLIEERQLYLEMHRPDENRSFDREVIAQIKALAAARGFEFE